jgi:hypothetical protein
MNEAEGDGRGRKKADEGIGRMRRVGRKKTKEKEK